MTTNRIRTTISAGLLAASFAAASANAQVLMEEDFDTPGDYQGWHVNGNQMVFPGGNPGMFMGVPYLDFMGITLSNAKSGSPVTGDLTRHGGPLVFSVDVNVLALDNFFGNPLDPSEFPLVLEFVDSSGPDGTVSVFKTGPGLPMQTDGWVRFTYEIPDPTMTDLPDGWGGTGDEDPNTFEPRLPPNRTYRSVMESVDLIRVTTFQPGWFYASNFWEMGFDNVLFELAAPDCPPDWNGDGVVDSDDLFEFLSDWAAGNADYNGDGVTDSDDLFDFLSDWAAGC